MSDFRELHDYEIDRLDDQRLLAYVDGARRADRLGAAMAGVRHLIYRHMDSVRERVRKKLPAHLVDDVTHDAIVEAIDSSFGGTSLGEFHKWLSVIVQRFIADFYRGPKGRQLERDRAAAMTRATDDDGDDLLVAEAGEEGGYEEAELAQLVDAVMARRSAPHRRAIDMMVFEGYSAKEAALETSLSEANCYQVVSRFRADLRHVLSGGDLDDPPGDTDPGP